MTKSIFLEKYPVNSLLVNKNEIKYKNIDEILNYLKQKIDEHDVATFISTFDNYAHTKSIGGEINPEIINAKMVIFCFGSKIPNIKILAARPRTIGVAELADSFAFEFLEAPNENSQLVMEEWVKDLVVK